MLVRTGAGRVRPSDGLAGVVGLRPMVDPLNRNTGFRRRCGAAVALAVALGVAAVSAQRAPRTPWGDPDLQGIWVGSTLTPLERPPEHRDQEFLTEREVAVLEAAAIAEDARLLARPRERAPAGGCVDYRADGSPGYYNNFWLEESTAWDASRRTSLIVDPPHGRIPYTATARDGERPYGAGPWDSHLDLDTGERCLGDGLPQIWFGDNPYHQIFQTPSDVVIVHEMYKQRRIIPIDGRPPTGIAQWNGEAARPLGGRHAGGREPPLSRPAARSLPAHLARPHRAVALRRAVHAGRRRHDRLRGHDHRPDALHPAVERTLRAVCGPG